MNARVHVFFTALFFYAMGTFSIPVIAQGSSEFLVTGIGYPPVRAESSSQALLMARRAALLDAYRNALQLEKDAETESDRFFQGVVGFLRNVRIVDESYLDDGAIMLTVAVKDVQVQPRAGRPAPLMGKQSPKAPREVPGPMPVTLQQWMEIIEQLVFFDLGRDVTSPTLEDP
jgi:hypothetical protein